MKVFLSHSSRDKWAARRIAEDIQHLGATIFLDEKDIETGSSIDVEIKKHLTECDDFVILLSPASVKSEWVLLELGGALALGKRIVPILLYVGVNEVPKAINLRLARDIGEVERYYDELSARMELGPTTGLGTKVVAPRQAVRKRKATGRAGRRFKVGDAVRIVATRPGDAFGGSLQYDWIDQMDSYLGERTTITKILGPDTGDPDGYELEIDRGTHGWAEEWLLRDTSS